MINLLEQFTDRICIDAEMAQDAYRRGVLTLRELAEWSKLVADTRLMLMRWLKVPME